MRGSYFYFFHFQGRARARVHLHEDSSVQADFSRDFELNDCSFPFKNTNTIKQEDTRTIIKEEAASSFPPEAASGQSEGSAQNGPHAEFARKVVHAIKQREEAMSEEIENFAKNRGKRKSASQLQA